VESGVEAGVVKSGVADGGEVEVDAFRDGAVDGDRDGEGV